MKEVPMGLQPLLKIALGFFILSSGLLPIACGNPSPSGPVTIVQTPVPTASPTPNGNIGVIWNEVTTNASFGPRYQQSTVVYNNLMWFIGSSSFTNDVWTSSTGATWNQILPNNLSPGPTQFPGRGSLGLLNFQNLMWIIGGQATLTSAYNDVWTSSNGSTWTNVLTDNASPGSSQFSQRYGFGCVSLKNLMWVVGGVTGSGVDLNDVWSSSNGSTWTDVLANNTSPGSTQFSIRSGAAVVAYNNLLWVIGGLSSTSNCLNDVWSSPDGVTWTNVLTNKGAPGPNQFSQRYGHTAIVFNNLMWVVGGTDYPNFSNFYNDVWYSSNGVTWTEANPSAPFVGRWDASSLAYNNEMFLIAGNPGLNGGNDDVWETP
jgi:hypothetical protein